MHTVVAAKFDLTDEKQRFMLEVIQRTHTGRWPLWRAFGMVQLGGYIYEAAQWRTSRNKPPQFSLLRWDLQECGISWQSASSRAAALSALHAIR